MAIGDDYFKNIENLFYRTRGFELKVVKNIFTRVQATIEAKVDRTVYYTYDIKDKDTPESIAHRYYGSVEYHWVVFLMNDIIDPLFDWPLERTVLEEFIRKKWGSLSSSATTVHHYETEEIRAAADIYGTDGLTIIYDSGDLILPAKIECPSDFTYTYWDGSNDTTVSGSDLVKTIYQYDYEFDLNESKREIRLLDQRFLPEFVEEFKNLTAGGFSRD